MGWLWFIRILPYSKMSDHLFVFKFPNKTSFSKVLWHLVSPVIHTSLSAFFRASCQAFNPFFSPASCLANRSLFMASLQSPLCIHCIFGSRQSRYGWNMYSAFDCLDSVRSSKWHPERGMERSRNCVLLGGEFELAIFYFLRLYRAL